MATLDEDYDYNQTLVIYDSQAQSNNFIFKKVLSSDFYMLG